MAELPGLEYPVPLATAQEPHISRLEIRKSRFLAQSFRAKSEREARDAIDGIKKLRRDATHNCWAFVAGRAGDTAHIGSSDDGEPSGTAGRPILNVLLHSGIGEIALVVTRWFGGIKLGTGGLSRAYQESASVNLQDLPLETFAPTKGARLLVPYQFVEPVKRLLAANGANVLSEKFAEFAEFEVLAPVASCSNLAAEVARTSSGSVIFEFMP